MAEGARLESVYTRNRIKGSNPFFTATFYEEPLCCKAWGLFVFGVFIDGAADGV